MKNLIIHNPYRILGVYVGDSPAVEQKNLARFRAFEKVGQTYEVALSGEEDLPKIERSEKRALEAMQSLSLPMERVRYSLLWYSDGLTQWGKVLNEAVGAVVKGDYAKAILSYDKLLTTPSLREEYVSAVTNGLGNISLEELSDILSKYIKEDKGFKEFLDNAKDVNSNNTGSNNIGSNNIGSNSRQIPSCFLSKWIYREQLEQNIKKSVKTLKDLHAEFEPAIDFYQSMDKLKEDYAEIEKDISVCRSIFGVDSIEYQDYAVQVAEAAYRLSKTLVYKAGDFVWNKKYKTQYDGYKKYQTKMLMPVIKECMRLIQETDNELNKFIADLRLSQNSEIILNSLRQEYNKQKSWEYVTDEEILRKSNRKFLITRGIIVAVWLTIVITIIVATMS